MPYNSTYKRNPFGRYTGYSDLLAQQQQNIQGNSAYDTGMAGVSKAGPIGGVIGGVTQLGDAIGRPIRKRAEEIDPETGAYRDIGKATRMSQVGSAFNPFKNVTETFQDPGATNREKWGAAIGMATGVPVGNLFAKGKYKRKEEERMAEFQKQKEDQLKASTYNQRMSELQSAPQMSFKNGGKLPVVDSNYMGRTGQRSFKDETFTFNPEQIRSAKVGDIVERSAFKIPNTDIVAGYRVRKKGESLPTMSFLDDRYRQYIIPQDGELQSIPEGFSGYANGGKMNYANGGYMEETRYNPDVTYFANGGTHEESSYGGIPLGKNRVEEKEIRYKDYIFSNRLPYDG